MPNNEDPFSKRKGKPKSIEPSMPIGVKSRDKYELSKVGSLVSSSDKSRTSAVLPKVSRPIVDDPSTRYEWSVLFPPKTPDISNTRYELSSVLFPPNMSDRPSIRYEPS